MSRRGNLANLKPFKPGQSGNPSGLAGVLPPEVRRERKSNQAGLIKLVSELLKLPNNRVKERLENSEISQLEVACQSMINQAKEGDTTAFKYLMELMVGRIPEHDYDGFTEEDIAILNRVKEVFSEQQRNLEQSAAEQGH